MAFINPFSSIGVGRPHEEEKYPLTSHVAQAAKAVSADFDARLDRLEHLIETACQHIINLEKSHEQLHAKLDSLAPQLIPVPYQQSPYAAQQAAYGNSAGTISTVDLVDQAIGVAATTSGPPIGDSTRREP